VVIRINLQAISQATTLIVVINSKSQAATLIVVIRIN